MFIPTASVSEKGDVGTSITCRGLQQFPCSSSSPPPDIAGETTEGPAPSTALSLEQERKHRDSSPQHKGKGTQSHIQTEQRGRTQNRSTDLQTDLQTEIVGQHR